MGSYIVNRMISKQMMPYHLKEYMTLEHNRTSYQMVDSTKNNLNKVNFLVLLEEIRSIFSCVLYVLN